MADEITITTTVNVTNGEYLDDFRASGVTFDQAASGGWKSIQDIGTSEESITSFGDVSTEGWCVLKNLDSTNYVQVGPATTSYMIRLEATEHAVFRLEPGADLFLKANTASCKVLVWVLED